MSKTNKQKKEERIQNIKTLNVLKYLKALGPDDMEEWNNRLESIEEAEDPIIKDQKVKELQVWLALKWVKANQSICLSCKKQSTCKRNQEKQKKCKFYIMKGDEDNENI